jgi:hypothetical protein
VYNPRRSTQGRELHVIHEPALWQFASPR